MERQNQEQKIMVARTGWFFLVILLLSLFTTCAKAACEPGLLFIEEGDIAPCTGYLIDPSIEKYFNDLYEENELLKKALEINDDILKELYAQNKTCSDQLQLCETTMRKVERMERANSLKRSATYVGVGIVLGILINHYAK